MEHKSQLNAEEFDKCIKWALKQGYELNYKDRGKWHQEDNSIIKTNKALFLAYIKSLEAKCKNECKCGTEGEKLHTCPYSQDIAGDSKTLCNCCISCENNCCADI